MALKQVRSKIQDLVSAACLSCFLFSMGQCVFSSEPEQSSQRRKNEPSSSIAASEAAFKAGKAKMLKGKYKEALAEYSLAIELDPRNALAHVNRGATYNCLKDDCKSILDYEQAIKIDPNLDIAYYNRGNCKRRLAKYDEAIDDYSRAIDLRSDYADAYYGKAWVFKLEAKYAQAEEFYLKASALYAKQNRDIAARESKLRAEECRKAK